MVGRLALFLIRVAPDTDVLVFLTASIQGKFEFKEEQTIHINSASDLISSLVKQILIGIAMEFDFQQKIFPGIII